LKLTKNQLKLIIESVLSEENHEVSEEGIAEIIDVIDPCEEEQMEKDEFVAKFPNWPVSMGEVLGKCASGIKFVEVEFSDGDVSQFELDDSAENDIMSFDEFTSMMRKNLKLKREQLAKLYDAGLITPLTEKDSEALEKKVTSSAKPTKRKDKSGSLGEIPPHKMTMVAHDGPMGLGTYYLDGDGGLVAFTPDGEITPQFATTTGPALKMPGAF
jgi:hypothetical protein